MKIAYISVIRNDHDVLPYNIQYYYNLGIREFYFMLHKDDGSLEQIIISHPAIGRDCHKYIFYNNTDDHYHDKDAQILIDAARHDGCNWIIGVDADELLILKKDITIHDFIEPFDKFDSIILKFKWIDYRASISIFSGNPFLQMPYVCTEYMDIDNKGWTKVCGKFNESMKFVPGFHDIIGCPTTMYINPECAFYAHFPERNHEQFKQKILIQRENWIKRYGYFYMDELLAKDPEYLDKIWPERIVQVDGSRQLYCQSNKNDDKKIMYYNYDPMDEKLFRTT